jgi:hypothetical protein
MWRKIMYARSVLVCILIVTATSVKAADIPEIEPPKGLHWFQDFQAVREVFDVKIEMWLRISDCTDQYRTDTSAQTQEKLNEFINLGVKDMQIEYVEFEVIEESNALCRLEIRSALCECTLWDELIRVLRKKYCLDDFAELAQLARLLGAEKRSDEADATDNLKSWTAEDGSSLWLWRYDCESDTSACDMRIEYKCPNLTAWKNDCREKRAIEQESDL